MIKMSMDEIREMVEKSKRKEQFDIISLDYASLYAVPMMRYNINPIQIRNDCRKRKIRKIYEPS